MADFNIAVKKTLIHEGGYVNDPDDSGGATKYGISQKQFPNVDIQNLSEEQAIAYYKDRYWTPFYDGVLDQSIADKLFDMGVLFGVPEAVETLQLTLEIDDDGHFGPVSLYHINQAVPATLLKAYQATLVTHALGIGTARPEKRKFVAGWITRINS